MDEQVHSETVKPPLPNLSPEIKQSLDKLLDTFKSQFVQEETGIGTTDLTKMQIDRGTSVPVSQKPYPVAMKHYNWLENEINKLLDAKYIYSSHSSGSALIIIVPKGQFVWPMQKVKDIFSKLNGVHYFSSLNLHAKYYHIPLDEDLIPKTAFKSPFGRYEYLKVPFRLAQAPAYFHELMNKVLKELPFAIACLNDVIICSKTAEQHLDYLQQVFHKLHNTKLSMKLSKCLSCAKEIQYQGKCPQHNQYKIPTLKNIGN